MEKLTPFAVTVLVLGLLVNASATIRHVPGQYPTIQAGIDAAVGGDTVLVADGTYTGLGNKNIDFLGKAILVTSENAPELTTINCQGAGRGFFFHCGEDTTSVLRGFTIQNGGGLSCGGGILCQGSSPWIVGNTIAWCAAEEQGGGIYCEGSSPRVERNTITGNSAPQSGGLYMNGGVGIIVGNLIADNSAWAAAGGGIHCEFSSPRIDGNTITGNSAVTYGGGIRSYPDTPQTVINTILWGNSASTGPQISLGAGSMDVSYCDVEGGSAAVHVAPGATLYWGEGNMDWDPLFVTGPLGDYYLSQVAAGQGSDSPCLDAGDPNSPVPGGAPTNYIPDLLDQPDTSVAENQYLTFTLEANDPDGDSIVFSSPDLPGGATLHAVTGLFQWTPTYAQSGLHTVTFIATDFGIPALADTEQTDITVTNVNLAPDLVDQADTTVAENQYLTFTLVATDPDEDSISFSSPDLPSGAVLGEATGLFEWTPTHQQAGLHTVTFIATDHGSPALADTEQTDITVTDVNQAPDLVDQPDTTIAENQYLTFTLEANDPDNDSIWFASPDLPEGAALNSLTGVFWWTPTYAQSGLYTVTFVATDMGNPALADTEQTDITVTDVVGVSDGDEELRVPLSWYLAQNRPNPFRSATTVQYGLVASAQVRLDIYDVRGALVRRLVDEKLPAGHHRTIWDGCDGRGHRAGSGVYFCRIEARDHSETKRMVLLR